MTKTPKQKCLEMWEWLAENPGKGKGHYYIYLGKQNRIPEYSSCWACKVAKTCNNCPITWHENHLYNSCQSRKSPYYAWDLEDSKRFTNYKYPDHSIQIKAAKQIIHLIKTTWED